MKHIALMGMAAAMGLASCNYQGGCFSRWGLGDATITLEDRCTSLNTAGKFKGSEEDAPSIKFSDCVTKDGTHILKEHTDWGIIESSYEFVPAGTPGTGGYQGGWGSRLGGDDQKLPVPGDCARILNVGKSGSKKYIACESTDGFAYLREFSDWGVFEATYLFAKEGRKDFYQGGWFSRLGGTPQVLALPEECVKVRSAGRTRNTKFVDCELQNGDRMLREFTDFGVFEAAYIFSRDQKSDFYQGGWLARVGGKPTIIQVPEDCKSIKNVGKAGSTKYIVCEAIEGAPFLQEFSDWGVFEARYRFGRE